MEAPDLFVGECNSTSIIFEVEVPEGVTYKNIEIQQMLKRSADEFQTVDISENHVIFIGNLVPNTEYYFRIRSKINDRTTSAWSEEVLVRTIKSHPFSMLLSNPLQL